MTRRRSRAFGGNFRRRRFRWGLTGIAIAAAAIVSEARPAYAQQLPAPGAPPAVPLSAPDPPASGLQVFVTPYLWLSGINAAINTPLQRAPQVNSDVSAIDVLSHLDGVPFMGAVEFRSGRFGLIGDVLHVRVGADITTRNQLYNGGNITFATNTGTAAFIYRAIDDPVQSLDGGIGLRAWGFSTDLTLNGAQLPTASTSGSAGWVDPLIVARYHREFGDGFGLTAYGDVGGFNVGARIDWQVVGTIDYALKPWVALRLGYRSLNFNWQGSNSNLRWNVHMKGPILAATFRF